MADLLVALVQIRLNNDRVASVGVIVLENDDPAPDLDLDRGTLQCGLQDGAIGLQSLPVGDRCARDDVVAQDALDRVDAERSSQLGEHLLLAVVPLAGQRVRQAPEGTVCWQERGERDIAIGEYRDRTVRLGGQDGPCRERSVASSTMIRIETTQGTLARRGFVDAEAAERVIDHWDDEYEPLLDVLAQCADPDHALTSLDRLCERVPGLLSRLIATPVLARQLIMVLGASNKLTLHLLAYPEHIELLTDRLVKVPATALRRELLEATGADPESTTPIATDPTGDQLRIAYRGALLRIAARDMCAPEPLEAFADIADELSDLADATLEAALSISRLKLGENALKTRLAVVALGKCGAQELNYVSDVDVLFVAEPAVDSDGTPLITNDQAVQIATRMAAEMTRICSAHTAAGTIWEVDAALRPEGKAGQLVRTLASHRIYYEKWAKTWEFQAMLKARPAAGDLELGQAFVDLVAPMVWSAAERENFVADTQAMRKRVVAHIPARDQGRELKLGEGGLRDVEFSVQLLQLVHGRVDERLRTRATLPALKILIDNGYVGREDGKGFALAYRFLRTLEHRIQLYQLRRTHLLPNNDHDLRRLGRSLGYKDPVKELLSTWRHTSQRVRRLHERLFYSPLLDTVAKISSNDLRLTPDAALDRLKALGYADPTAALRHIAALSQGVTRQAEIQRQLLPAMLGWFAEAPNPDHGLLAFRQVSEALGTTPWYLRALRDEGAMAERLARILASSRYAVELLKRAPQTVQMLADDQELRPRSLAELKAEMHAAAGRQSSSVAAVEAIRAIRRRELFRVAAGDLLGENDVVRGRRSPDRLGFGHRRRHVGSRAGSLGCISSSDCRHCDGPVGRSRDVVLLRCGRHVRHGGRHQCRRRPHQGRDCADQ